MWILNAINDAIVESNIYVSAIMVVAIAWGVLAFAHEEDGDRLPKLYPGVPAAVLFWLVWWLLLLVVYSLLPNAPGNYWKLLLFDGFGNIALIATAWSLAPEGKIKPLPLWRFLGYLLASCLTIMAWNILLGKHFNHPSIPWRIFVAFPGMLLATIAFFFLAFSASSRYPAFSTEIRSICVLYGLCQPPAYYCNLIDPEGWKVSAATLSGLLALGKLFFVMVFVSILLARNETEKSASGLRFIKSVLTVVSVVLSVISIAVRLAVSFK